MKLAAFSVFWIVALSPFQWLILADYGGLSLKPVHLAFSLLAFSTAFHGRRAFNLLFRNRLVAYFVSLYALYLLVTYLAVLWSPDLASAMSYTAKETIYFLFFVMLSGQIALLHDAGKLKACAGMAACVGLLLFVAYAILLFRALGYNLLQEYADALTSANVIKLHHWFYPKLFNCTMSGHCTSADEGLLSNLRNTLLGTVVVYFMLILWWRQSMSAGMKVALSSFAFIAAVVIMLSVSRSNIIAFFLAVGACGIAALRRNHNSSPRVAMAILFIVLTLPFMMLLPQSEGIQLILEERFGNFHDDPRATQYSNAVDLIDENVLWGSGIGTGVSTGTEELPVHNVFLKAWLETGIAGFLLAISWYAVIVIAFLQAALNFKNNSIGHISIWLIGLPMLPLFRSLVSSGVNFSLNEWCALAFFFGIASVTKAYQGHGIARNRPPILSAGAPLPSR